MKNKRERNKLKVLPVPRWFIVTVRTKDTFPHSMREYNLFKKIEPVMGRDGYYFERPLSNHGIGRCWIEHNGIAFVMSSEDFKSELNYMSKLEIMYSDEDVEMIRRFAQKFPSAKNIAKDMLDAAIYQRSHRDIVLSMSRFVLRKKKRALIDD